MLFFDKDGYNYCGIKEHQYCYEIINYHFLVLFSIPCFSQKTTLKVLDVMRTHFQKERTFFSLIKQYRLMKKGSFFFKLKKENSITFSVTHLKYETKAVVYSKSIGVLIVFLKEKQETSVSI